MALLMPALGLLIPFERDLIANIAAAAPLPGATCTSLGRKKLGYTP